MYPINYSLLKNIGSNVSLPKSRCDRNSNCAIILQNYFLPFQDCNTEKMTKLKAVPNTSCESSSQEICVTPECPVVFLKKVCDAKKNSHVALLPQVRNWFLFMICFYLITDFIFFKGILSACTKGNLHWCCQRISVTNNCKWVSIHTSSNLLTRWCATKRAH